MTRIEITNKLVRSGTKKFGINLGEPSFYDSGQTLKNLVGRNPGFEPLLYQSVMRCAAGTATSCTDDQPGSAWPDGFWQGGAYRFISGRAQDHAGVIGNFQRSKDSAGSIYKFNRTGVPPAAGDYFILSKKFSGDPTAGWWTEAGPGAVFSPNTRDLPNQTSGAQCLDINAIQSRAVLHSYFDSTAGKQFVRFKGAFEVAFKAKPLRGRKSLRLMVKRGSLQYLDKDAALQPGWADYRFPFEAAENTSASGTAELSFVIQGAEVLMDEVSLMQTDTSSDNHTVFRDPVVQALREFQPGILRDWSGQLGDTLDNQIAPQFQRLRSGYSSFGTTKEDIGYGLHEFLELCAVIHSEPWYVVPITFSPAEMANLIDYLQGSPNTRYGAKRAARGRVQPWTDEFSKIHLEFGNESWNPLFTGGAIQYPEDYGRQAGRLFAAARAAIGPSMRYDLVVGGQAENPGRNAQILSAATNYDSFTVAPYLMNEVNRFDTAEHLFGPLLAQPQQVDSPGGYMDRNRRVVDSAPQKGALSVYEVNLSTTQGSISQTALDQLTPSLGAGLAVAEHMLLMLRDLDVRDQLLFKLGQYDFKRGDGKMVRLWGSVVDTGVTNRRRPQFLAAALVNQAIGGDLLTTKHTGSDPVWNQPALNGVEAQQAHYLLSFAFADGHRHSAVLFNLHRTSALNVNLWGINAPSGRVKLQRLASGSLANNNETGESVRITTQFISLPSGTMLNLPPGSLSVLTWDSQ